MSDDNETLMQSIFEIQQECDPIKKTAKGQVGSRSYNYANLNDVWDAVRPLMLKHSVGCISSPTGSSGTGSLGNFFKMTLFSTKTGESLTETMPMILQRDDPQALGAAITYYRRYMLVSMLGLITDDDNDAREQRLATLEQKQKIMGAVKLAFPDVVEPARINELLKDILGKHPSMIREDEAENAIKLIKSYKD